MNDRLLVASVQSTVGLDARENGRQVRDLMREARAAGARLVHFPEGAMSGYPSGAGKERLKGWAVDWAALRGELEATADLARDLGLWVVVGANHPLSAPNPPHNSLYVISDRGELAGRYDKRLLSHSEVTDWYSPGFEPYTFRVDDFAFGCALCIEIHFAEVFLEYARLGIDCLLLSSFSRTPMFAVQAQGHAAGNNYWISFSVPAQCSDAAPAGVIGPDGRWLARCHADGAPGLALAELDRTTAEMEFALVRARGWRAISREGSIYTARRVDDPRSSDRTSF